MEKESTNKQESEKGFMDDEEGMTEEEEEKVKERLRQLGYL